MDESAFFAIRRHNRASLEAVEYQDLVSKNIRRRFDALRLSFRRCIMRRTVWKPFQVPSCDANLGWRLTDCRANDKEYQ